jgi:hypothetical protein
MNQTATRPEALGTGGSCRNGTAEGLNDGGELGEQRVHGDVGSLARVVLAIGSRGDAVDRVVTG